MHRLTVAALAAFLGFSPIGACADVLELYGATTVQKEIIDPLAEQLKKATGIEVRTYGVGTGKGMIALFQGKTSVAMVSESLEDALYTTELVAKRDGVGYRVPTGLTMTELGRDRLIVIVNADNPVVGLTRSQIRDIFTGRITNWQDVGGSNAPIRPVVSVLGNAIRTVVQRKIMDGTEYGAGTAEVSIPSEAIPMVSGDKGAIAVVSLLSWGRNSGATKFIAAPELDHPLGLVTIGKPGGRVQRLIGFVRANSLF